jgi:hypothetical protein
MKACEKAARAIISMPCPSRLPKPTEPCSRSVPKKGPTAGLVRDRGEIDGIDFGYCYPFENRPRRNHPRRFLHLIILRASSGYAHPGEDWIRLGERKISAQRGTLFRVPQPSYHGDHLAFRWGSRKHGFLVSLHSWDDVQATEELLANLIEGLALV